MDKSNKLMFFNKDGYPYNFQYDEIEKKWEGKILFEENSSELFKTIGLYIFEKLDSFNFSSYFNFELSQLFNWSGLTCVQKTFDDQIITNIEKVNNDSNFYTKWIYGDRFDVKFSVGTVVTFTGNTIDLTEWYWGDFIDDVYFTVMGSKNNAVLISTETNNSLFTGFTFITGATLSSHNIIKIPTYGGDDLIDFSGLGYYSGKKLTMVNSSYNDGILTYVDYKINKRKYYDFELSFSSFDKLNIDITLYTERPKLYSGLVDIQIYSDFVTGTTIVFENGINSNIDFLSTGQTMIFEKYNGDGILPLETEFTIMSYEDKEYILDDELLFRTAGGRNYILIDIPSLTGLTFVDQIYLEAYPFVSGSTNHNERTLDVVSITSVSGGVSIEVGQYLLNELNRYKIYKILKKNQVKTLYAHQEEYILPTGYTGESNCFTTSNVINIEQDIILSGGTGYFYKNTIDALNLNYGNYLRKFGIQLFHYSKSGVDYLIAEGIFDYNYESYFDITSSINGVDLLSGNTLMCSSGYSDVYNFEVEEDLINEEINLFDDDKLNVNFSADIILDLNNDLIDYGFKIILNSVEYFINYSSTSGLTSYTNQTINDFIDKYYNIFNSLGFNIYSGLTNNIYIDGKYPNVEVIDLDVFVNIYSNYTIDTTYNSGIIISGNQLVCTGVTLLDLMELELSTGMIISVDGSDYVLNNKEYNIIGITRYIIQLSYQGPFFENNNVLTNITVNEFLRKPRSYYNKDIDYKFSWVSQDTGEITNDIFFYDYSGDQLVPYNNIPGLTYNGVTPLNYNNESKVFLNKYPNKFDSEVNNPSLQQTVFDDISFRLENLDDSDSYNYVPIPLELFIGFNSPNEGVSMNEMILEKIETCVYSGVTQNSGSTEFQKHYIITGNTISYITNNYLFDFTEYGFEVDQLISIDIGDNSLSGQTIFNNYDNYRIKDITPTKIFIDSDYNGNLNDFNTIEMLNNSGKTFTFIIETKPRELLRCKIYGQSEIEDERYDINLRNLGIDIQRETELIFKDSDVNEHSVDYSRLNRKRKEMLSIYTQIFNYVGSYKALIYSIDYFGYNDLQLYEYYRNIKSDSSLYGKLHKILIPDIFDNTVDGWESNDYIKNKYDKGYYRKTNLFNLTYRITDIYGNYSLQYSLDDVQIKLMSLIKWLRKNVIPLSSNIRDITGIADTNHSIELRYDSSIWSTKSVIDQDVVGVNFYYTATKILKNNYLLSIDFYVLSGNTSPNYFTIRIKTFSFREGELIPQQNIILYKTDYDPYSLNMNSDVDPYISIEVTSFNGYGVGYSNSKMFKYDEMKNFYLVNTNFNATMFPYFEDDNGYYLIDDNRYYIIKK